MLELITEAVDKALTLHFDYDDKHRVVEVHAVGRSIKAPHDLVMRVFQVNAEPPTWKLMNLAKIKDLSMSSAPMSQAPRPGYKQGDKFMSEIIKELLI